MRRPEHGPKITKVQGSLTRPFATQSLCIFGRLACNKGFFGRAALWKGHMESPEDVVSVDDQRWEPKCPHKRGNNHQNPSLHGI